MNCEMNWIPSLVRRNIESVRLYNQLINMAPSRLNRQVFLEEKGSMATGSWSTNIKSICDTGGYPAEWENLQSVSIKELRSKLVKMYKETLSLCIEAKPKLRTFRLLNDGTEVATHLRVTMEKHKRSLISQFHLGCLPIRLETGRYVNLPISERICELCDEEVETEIHFLLECPSLKGTRKKLLNGLQPIQDMTNNAEKLKMLCEMPFLMGNLLNQLWKTREQVLTGKNNRVYNNRLQWRWVLLFFTFNYIN